MCSSAGWYRVHVEYHVLHKTRCGNLYSPLKVLRINLCSVSGSLWSVWTRRIFAFKCRCVAQLLGLLTASILPFSHRGCWMSVIELNSREGKFLVVSLNPMLMGNCEEKPCNFSLLKECVGWEPGTASTVVQHWWWVFVLVLRKGWEAAIWSALILGRSGGLETGAPVVWWWLLKLCNSCCIHLTEEGLQGKELGQHLRKLHPQSSFYLGVEFAGVQIL